MQDHFKCDEMVGDMSKKNIIYGVIAALLLANPLQALEPAKKPLAKKAPTATVKVTVAKVPKAKVGPEETARARFLHAESAFKQGQHALYEKLKKGLEHYPLYPYLLFEEHLRNIHTLSLAEFQSFMTKYADSPLSEQLRTQFLHATAKQEAWQSFLKAYVPNEDLSLQCHFLWSEHNAKDNKHDALQQVKPLWLRGTKPPEACHKLFKAFEASPLMTRSLIWQRIKLAIQQNNEALARAMTTFIPKAEKALVELWILIHKNPYLITQKKYFKDKHAANLEMIVHGVSVIAKKHPETAIQVWQQLHKDHPFQERHWGLVVRAIGLSFAADRHPDAEKWLRKVPASEANTLVHEWRIRVALLKEDWQSVLHWTTTLPQPLNQHEAWNYWQAIALDKLDHPSEAAAIFSKLAKTRSYYGFLSSQKLQKPYSIDHQKMVLEENALFEINRRKSVQRARELLLIGREDKARTEWLYICQRMTDKDRHAAATLAIQWNLPNWSILALSKAHNKNALELRFPLVHTQSIMQEARRHQIDPSLVFAVTRQESAFVNNAKSPAGALGLMQLMPGTAHMVAKKHQISLQGHQKIFEPATNIRLGTSYLRMMLDTYQNHPALATAAYNAGPGRVRKWMPENTMPADAWVETIPIRETRDYVQNVMTYAVIYQQLLGLQNKPVIYPLHIQKSL